MSMNFVFRFRSCARCHGVTLVELMIAMVISLVVLLAVGTIYFNTKRTYSVQDEYSRMQESALYAFQTLTQDISTAGFAGCSPVIKNLLNVNAGNLGLFNFTDGIFGWEYTGTAPGDAYADVTVTPAPVGNAGNWSDNNAQVLDGSLAGNVIPGSDVLLIKSSKELSSFVPDTDVDPQSLSIHFASPTLKSKGAIFLVSDCNNADLFMNSDGPGDNTLSRDVNCGGALPCNKAGEKWSHAYNKNELRIYTSTSRAYYIGQGVNKEPALFRYKYDNGLAAAGEELVDGVENMQILYGVDLNSDPNGDPPVAPIMPIRYLSINNVPDLRKVVSIRISLLMRSTGKLDRPDDNNTYKLGGTQAATAVTVTPLTPDPDHSIHKVFTTTIALRNMAVSGRIDYKN